MKRYLSSDFCCFRYLLNPCNYGLKFKCPPLLHRQSFIPSWLAFLGRLYGPFVHLSPFIRFRATTTLKTHSMAALKITWAACDSSQVANKQQIIHWPDGASWPNSWCLFKCKLITAACRALKSCWLNSGHLIRLQLWSQTLTQVPRQKRANPAQCMWRVVHVMDRKYSTFTRIVSVISTLSIWNDRIDQ